MSTAPARPYVEVLDNSKGRGQCRSCHVPIFWFMLTSGKRHPFNTDVYLRTRHDDNGRLVGAIGREDSHFATCPHAKDWSRK